MGVLCSVSMRRSWEHRRNIISHNAGSARNPRGAHTFSAHPSLKKKARAHSEPYPMGFKKENALRFTND